MRVCRSPLAPHLVSFTHANHSALPAGEALVSRAREALGTASGSGPGALGKKRAGGAVSGAALPGECLESLHAPCVFACN